MKVALEVAQVSKASCGTSYCDQITIGYGDPRAGGRPFVNNHFTSISEVIVGPRKPQNRGPVTAKETSTKLTTTAGHCVEKLTTTRQWATSCSVVAPKPKWLMFTKASSSDYARWLKPGKINGKQYTTGKTPQPYVVSILLITIIVHRFLRHR